MTLTISTRQSEFAQGVLTCPMSVCRQGGHGLCPRFVPRETLYISAEYGSDSPALLCPDVPLRVLIERNASVPTVILSPQSVLPTAAGASLSYQTLLTPHQRLHSTLEINPGCSPSLQGSACIAPMAFPTFPLPPLLPSLRMSHTGQPTLPAAPSQHQPQSHCTCYALCLQY